MVRFAIASLFSRSILGVFLFIIASLVFYFANLYAAFGLAGILLFEALLFALVWRFGPWLYDHIYAWLYHAQWLSPEEFQEKDAELHAFIITLCEKEHIAVPKFGFIDDDNPQAFSYGSDHWNGRIVFTKGIFTFLEKEERKAVAAHELGHIVHRDFIIMTIAAFILTVLYTVGRTLIRTRGRKNPLPLIGLISLFFYYVGEYILLYLSRVREYWADDYAKEALGSGNPLATALVKIAYGIVASPDKEKTRDLMEGTRTMGVYDHKHAKTFGNVGADYVKYGDSSAVVGAMVFDMHNLWAFWQELSSSHP